MLTCQSVVELVTDYLEGALPTRERAAFEAHLAGCAACSVFVDQMRRTVATLQAVGPDLPVPSCDDLVDAFRSYRGAPSGPASVTTSRGGSRGTPP